MQFLGRAPVLSNRNLALGFASFEDHQLHSFFNSSSEQCAFLTSLRGNTPIGISTYVEPVEQSWCAVFGYVDGSTIRPGSTPEERFAKHIYETFRRQGIDAACNQNGIYAIFIYDSRKQILFYAVDKFGFFPLYYARSKQNLFFATDMQLLLSAFGEELDHDGIEEYLELGFPLDGRTFYRDIARVQGGEFFKLHANHLSSHRYFTFDKLPEGRARSNEAVGRLSESIGQSIREKVATVQRPVCLLSGGYYSRMILLEMFRSGVEPYTFSVEELDLRFDTPSSTIRGIVSKLLGDDVAPHNRFIDPPALDDLCDAIELRESMLNFQSEIFDSLVPAVEAIPLNAGTNFDGTGAEPLISNPFFWWPVEVGRLFNDLDGLADEISATELSVYFSKNFTSGLSAPLFERVRAVLEKIPATPHRLTLFGLQGYGARVLSLFPLTVLSQKIESYLPYMDDHVLESALNIDPFFKLEKRLGRVILNTSFPASRSIPSSHTSRETMPPDVVRNMSQLFPRNSPLNTTHNGTPLPYRTAIARARFQHSLTYLPEEAMKSELLSLRSKALITLAKTSQIPFVKNRLQDKLMSYLWPLTRIVKLTRIEEQIRNAG